MFSLSPVVLGIILSSLGVGFILLTLLLLYLIPKLQPAITTQPTTPADFQTPAHEEAVLLIQRGGRVAYINKHARELFDLREEAPTLEGLARRTRPSEAFLSLCASEGQARFSLNSRFVEGTSYFAYSFSKQDREQVEIMLVTIHRPQLILDGSSPLSKTSDSSSTAHTAEVTTQALGIFTELSQSITASLDINTTIQTILESIERLITSDFLEITIWENEQELLVPYRMIGLPGIDRRLEKIQEYNLANQGYSEYLITHREPLLIQDVNTFRDIRSAVDRQHYPFQSYLGVPLTLAGKFIGTLELASLSQGNYSENDLEVVKLLSRQAAIALNNALLYEQEQQRVIELAGLANLAQAVSTISDLQDLYTHLTKSITPLLQVKVLGFLVYDENRHFLDAQIPFYGIPSDIANWYQVPIAPGTPGAEIWQNAETIVAINAPEDPRLQALELHHLAQTVGIRHTVFAPLTPGGRMIGYIQAAKKIDETPFDQNDLRLLTIIAGQTGPIIENATLMQQSRRRAQRAETLRRIASLTSSAATINEILKFSVLDVSRLLGVDISVIFLLNETRGELRLHQDSIFGISPQASKQLRTLTIEDPLFTNTVTAQKNQVVIEDFQKQPDILPSYQTLFEDLEIRSAIAVPLITRERGVGEMVVGSRRINYFNQGDIQTVATAAGQLASAIEQSVLYSQTDQSLRQRVDQLTALTRISRELNTSLDLEHLLQRVFDEAINTTQASCGTILLFELPASDHLSYQDATLRKSQLVPEVAIHIGDPPDSLLHPLEQKVLKFGKSVIINDFLTASEEDGKPTTISDDLSPAHEGIRSALVIPIAYQEQIAGLLHLHSSSPNHFGSSELEIGEALAIQAAIALGNAHRYQEQVRRSELLNRRVDTLSKLFEVSQAMQEGVPFEDALETIAYAIQASTPFDIVLISVYDLVAGQLRRVANAGIPLSKMEELRARPQPWEPIIELMQTEFRLGNTYLVPEELLPTRPAELHTVTLLSGDQPLTKENQWRPKDLFFVPLFDTQGDPLGLISIDAPRNHQRPDRPSIETLEIFGSHAALVIENRQKLQHMKARLNETQSELELARDSAEQTQSQLSTLVQKDIETTTAFQHLSQQARRINAGLDIAATVNRQTTRSNILHTLGQETLEQMGFDFGLVAEPTSGGLHLSHTLGNIPENVNLKALLGQRNPLRHSLQTRETLLISELDQDAEWHNTPLLRALDTQSYICVPISEASIVQSSATGYGVSAQAGAQDGVQAAFLAISTTPQAPFTSEDEGLFRLLSMQVSVAIQNLALLDETTRRLREVNLLLDFSYQLGSLDPVSILHTLVESALNVVPSAQAAMVAIWDGHQNLLVPQAASGYASNESLLEVLYRPGEGIPGQVFEGKQALFLNEVDFARHYNLPAENLLRYRKARGGHLPVSSIAVPIMARIALGEKNGVETDQDETWTAPLGVLVLDNAQITDAFTEDDLAVIASLAQQTALTLENARLYQGSERRSDQLQALTDVATTITSSLQTEDLIASVLDQLQTILLFDTGTLWLRPKLVAAQSMQSIPDKMVVRAARGFDDTDQRIGLSVDVQDSQLLNEMIHTCEPIWVTNVLHDERFRALSMQSDLALEDDQDSDYSSLGQEHLSWLGVPLILSGNVIGVIALEKTEPNFYTDDDIKIATAFAGQVAIGLENAVLFEESTNRSQELAQQSQTLTILHRLSSELSGSLEADHILNFSAKEFLQIIPCTAVSVLIYEEEHNDPLKDRIILQADYSRDSVDSDPQFRAGAVLPDTPIFNHLRETLGIFNTDNVHQEPALEPLQQFLNHHQTRSLLIIPIVSGQVPSPSATLQEHHFHGILLAHNDQPYGFDADEVELARTISNQIAIALQNARLFEETRSLTEDLEIRVQQRTSELEYEQQRAETLLRIITELSASLDLDQVLQSTLQVLSEYVDAEQITILIARPGEEKLHRLASVGYAPGPPEEGEPTPLKIDEGLAGWIISQRQSVLIENVQKDERWVQLSSNEEKAAPFTPLHHSALGVPLMSGAEALGSLLLFHHRIGHFSVDQLDLVQAAANQVSVAVNNAELYKLIRDQAEDLGSMLRSQQIETSRSKAILEAVADGVLVTDEDMNITLFNESAEQILALERSNIVGRSMDHFSGLFGRAAQSWMGTIRKWSQDPTTYQPGDTYAEKITIEDGRVISVHLAPVSWQNDFLGTVSIFQDITLQVEVDRLKSEFVATVSHELRTPMTSIKGYVEILLLGAAGKLSKKQNQFLQIVKTNTERLSVLVNDLLDISQIEAGRTPLSLQPIHLEEITGEVIAEIKRRSQEDRKPVKIEVDIQSHLPRAFGDPDRVRQIFDSLIDNAYQYNTPHGTITFRIHKSNDEIQVDISDSGVGIQPSDQPRIFERFFRGENPLVLGVSGTGLGLSIVKNLIQMHDGRIWFESSGVQGEGSTFHFTLPQYSPKNG